MEEKITGPFWLCADDFFPKDFNAFMIVIKREYYPV